jgi:cell division septation protein DedD
VAVATYQVLALAQERVDQLADEEEGTPFYIAPTVVQGSLFYRVLAGPLPDSTAAVAVRDTLIARKVKTFSSGTDVLATPYAFLLGTFENRSQAEARMDAVAKLNIPSYIVMSSAPDGAARYILYAGAYTGRGDAEFMRGILNGASLPDTLVERTGSIRS